MRSPKHGPTRGADTQRINTDVLNAVRVALQNGRVEATTVRVGRQRRRSWGAYVAVLYTAASDLWRRSRSASFGLAPPP
eukprot:2787218-Pyramimonas_sp.AAC.1